MTAWLLLLGLVAAGGVVLAAEALAPRPVRLTLTAADERPWLPRLLDTFMVPAAQRLARIGRRDGAAQRADLALRLARAGYPAPFTTPEAVLGYRCFTAALFAGMAGVFLLVLALVLGGGLGGLALPIMLGLGVLGWQMPDQTLKNAEAQRREQLTLDAASSLDRLAIFISGGFALPMALRALAERPGGAWIGEFRQVAADYAVNGDFTAALGRAGARSGGLPEITRVTERLKAAYEMGGGGLAVSLRRMAVEARTRIRLVITERGYKNAVLMVIPAFFAIIAIALILIAPGAAQMLWILGG